MTQAGRTVGRAPHASSSVRVVYAFILAPALVPAGWIIAALVLGSQGWVSIGLLTLVFFAYLPALVLGVPTYLIARRRGVRLTSLRAAITGALVASAPWLVVAVGLGPRSAALWLVAIAAAAGSVSGLAFWVVAAWGSRRQV